MAGMTCSKRALYADLFFQGGWLRKSKGYELTGMGKTFSLNTEQESMRLNSLLRTFQPTLRWTASYGNSPCTVQSDTNNPTHRLGRGSGYKMVGVSSNKDDPAWETVKFCVYDAPKIEAPFEIRYDALMNLQGMSSVFFTLL